jgi:CDP-diacylglycerol--glycerol-3-phosphate 3-phosphatidyltransferase
VPLVTNIAAVLDRMRSPVVDVLAAVGIRPNHLTILGGLIAASSGYAAAQGELRIAGAVFLGGSLLDAFDGALARRTGRVSVFGAFLDSLLDRVGEGLLLLGILVYFIALDDDRGVVLAFGVTLVSVLVSYARARAEGLGLRGVGVVSPRSVRVAILVAGLLLNQLIPALALILVLSIISVVQRTVSVWRQT